MSKQERAAYDEHLNAVMIQNDVLDTAKMEGVEEGRKEGLAEGRAEGEQQKSLEIARKLKSMGIEAAAISSATGLADEEIAKL